MNKTGLNGLWECELRDGRNLEISVPGCWDTYIDEKDVADKTVFTKTFEINDKSGYYHLCFGAVSYYCDVYLNKNKVGSHEGMWDSFYFDVTDDIKIGKNELELHIWKPGYNKEDRFYLREVLSGFIPDVLCTFGGIWNDVYLENNDMFFVKNHHGQGKISGKTNICCEIDCKEDSLLDIELSVYVGDDDCIKNILKTDYKVSKGINKIDMDFVLENPKLWDSNNHNLYKYNLKITSENQEIVLTKTFGFREIKYNNGKLILNDNPIYLRGVLHWGFYPDKITPTPTREEIINEIASIKKQGFNMIKHCLYIPSKEYLEIADEMGLYQWIELPLWLPDFTSELEPRIRREFPEILDRITGHPSVILTTLGCELDDSVGEDVLKDMYKLVKESTDTLVRDNSGSGECYDGLAVDYADFFDYHFYADAHNMEPIIEAFTPAWRNYRPWFFGEFCDSDTIRDMGRARKSSEKVYWELDDPVKNPVSILKPDFYLGEYDNKLKQSGIKNDFDYIKKLSLDHSTLHRKNTLEQTRSFPEITGYNITAIRDVPIASCGLFDDEMKLKFNDDVFKQFNDDVVLLPAWDLSRIWINSDFVQPRERYNFMSGSTYSLHILLSNYGNRTIENPCLSWKLFDKDSLVMDNTVKSEKAIEISEVTEIGYIFFDLPKTEEYTEYILEVKTEIAGKEIKNSWPIFVYPKLQGENTKIGLFDPVNIFEGIENLFDDISVIKNERFNKKDVVIASFLSDSLKKYIHDGGKAIIVQRGKGSLPTKNVAFWREGMIRPYYDHPIFMDVEKHSWMDDLRWFPLGTNTAIDTFDMQSQGFTNIKPIVRRYDCRQWETSDYLAEMEYGKGKLIVSSLRFEGGLGKQPLLFDNNCFGKWLIKNMANYLA